MRKCVGVLCGVLMREQNRGGRVRRAMLASGTPLLPCKQGRAQQDHARKDSVTRSRTREQRDQCFGKLDARWVACVVESAALQLLLLTQKRYDRLESQTKKQHLQCQTREQRTHLQSGPAPSFPRACWRTGGPTCPRGVFMLMTAPLWVWLSNTVQVEDVLLHKPDSK